MSGGFGDLGLMPELIEAVESLGWILPTEIQQEAIPLIMGGGDVMGAAETGSGKTAAFALPIVQCVHERIKGATSKKRRAAETPIIVKLNENDRDSVLNLANDGYACSYFQSDIWVGIRATYGVNAGKYFYEVYVTEKGNCRIGWSTMAAHLELGKDAHGFGYGGKGWKSNNGAFDRYGDEYTKGDFVGCYLDIADKSITFSVNGKILSKAFDISETVQGSVLYPAVALSGASVEVNFGQKPFRFPPSPDFISIGRAKGTELYDVDSVESYIIPGKRKPLALIIEPTRDLAEQVYQNIVDFTRFVMDPTIRTLLLIGDSTRSNSKSQLHEGVDIVVATLGKLLDMIQTQAIDLSHIRFFVLDEADKLTQSENLQQIKDIYAKCPGGGTGYNRLQVCFFSATLHSEPIKQLSELICMNPTWIDLKGQETVLPDTVHHVLLPVDISHYATLRQECAVQILPVTDEVHTTQELQPPTTNLFASQQIKEMKLYLLKKVIDTYQMSHCMIFCRTNVDCFNLSKFLTACSMHDTQNHSFGSTNMLQKEKYSHRILSGKLSMQERREHLLLFKNNEIQFLVCTDVAARGIDVTNLPYVIQMTLSEDIDDYIHRIGRVGRSDTLGLAITIVSTDAEEKVWYHTCSNRNANNTCFNRALMTAGKGCCKWISEKQIVEQIEKKINLSIPRITDYTTLQLPDVLQVAAKGIQYGEKVNEAFVEGGAAHANATSKLYMTDYMKDAIKNLVALELTSQEHYLELCFNTRKCL